MVMAVLDRPSGGGVAGRQHDGCRTGFVEPGASMVARPAGPAPVVEAYGVAAVAAVLRRAVQAGAGGGEAQRAPREAAAACVGMVAFTSKAVSSAWSTGGVATRDSSAGRMGTRRTGSSTAASSSPPTLARMVV